MAIFSRLCPPSGKICAYAFSLVACLSAAFATSLSPANGFNSKKPNIIFILADDLGYGDVGCYGQKQITTPNLDRMAAEGMRFTDAYAGAAVCAPSRCVLMTGMHVGHATIRGNREAAMPGAALAENDITVAQVLKDAGYATGAIGKWGLGETTRNQQGLPWKKGFDFFYGYLRHGPAHNYYPDHLWRNESTEQLPNVISQNPAYKGNVADRKVQYSHDLFADEALNFVRDHKDGPFFLYLAFTIPHANNEAGKNGMEVPDYGSYAKTDWPNSEKGKAAMISRMDGDIGRLLALLKELRIEEKTLVMFASDNGPPENEGGRLPEFNDSNGPLRGFKGEVTEGGIRVPFIARWPGYVPAGVTSELPIGLVDVMPTLAHLAEGNTPSGIDGVNFGPTLAGTQQPEMTNRFLYWEWGKNGVHAQAARWNQWKSVRYPKTKKIELYNLATDVGESRNVAVEHPGLVAKFNKYFATARSASREWPVIARPSREETAMHRAAATVQ
jgi:uncharacterized sulfatase